MKTTLPRRRLLAAAAALPLVAANRVRAQGAAWPAKPVRMIVPYPAGGATDVVSRAVAAKLQELWGQTVVVENRAGASGTIGNDAVAKAPPDGYTLLMAIAALIQQPPLMKLPYDPLKDLAPVTQVVLSGNLFCVGGNTPVNTLAEFVALAKANPGKFSYGTFGAGSSSHIQGALFNLQAGLDLAHIPYKGSAPLINDLIGGQVSAAMVDATTASPHLKSGKFKVLAAGGTQRNRAAPGVPTFQELGYHSFDWYGWVGMFMPAGTPAPVVAKASADTARVLKMPDIVSRFEGLGLPPVGSTPEEFGRTLRRDAQLFEKIIRDAKITMD